MNLQNLKSVFSANGCNKIYLKNLSANDNSKNQVYFGGNFEVLNILPISEITTEEPGDYNKERFKAKIKFSWILSDGTLTVAPKSQLILYPKYPEVRFSGFLSGSKNAPSELMTKRIPERLLFFGVTKIGEVIGYVVAPDSEIAKELNDLNALTNYGVFRVIELPIFQNSRQKLITELLRIHQLGWIKSKKLNGKGEIMSCESTNCGGLTLEAELGITQNGYSEPDYLGWEVKQFGVKKINLINSQPITLMTPEPTHGLYKNEGSEFFIRKYGYLDKTIENRMNFNGSHKVGVVQNKTNLRLELLGYDYQREEIFDVNGKIALIDKDDKEAASWSFSSMLIHWNRKHNQACYVPSLLKNVENGRNYSYGKDVILGTGTDFLLFLKQMSNGNIYYDPGIKIENISTKPKVKPRSQFRIKSGNLSKLYKINETIDITKQ